MSLTSAIRVKSHAFRVILTLFQLTHTFPPAKVLSRVFYFLSVTQNFVRQSSSIGNKLHKTIFVCLRNDGKSFLPGTISELKMHKKCVGGRSSAPEPAVWGAYREREGTGKGRGREGKSTSRILLSEPWQLCMMYPSHNLASAPSSAYAQDTPLAKTSRLIYLSSAEALLFRNQCTSP